MPDGTPSTRASPAHLRQVGGELGYGCPHQDPHALLDSQAPVRGVAGSPHEGKGELRRVAHAASFPPDERNIHQPPNSMISAPESRTLGHSWTKRSIGGGFSPFIPQPQSLHGT